MNRLWLALAFWLSFAIAAAAQYQQTSIKAQNCAGTVAVGGTAVTPIAAAAAAHGFAIINEDTTEPLWVSFTGAAVVGGTASWPLAPGAATTYAGAGSFVTPPGFATGGAVSVNATTAGHKFSCVFW